MSGLGFKQRVQGGPRVNRGQAGAAVETQGVTKEALAKAEYLRVAKFAGGVRRSEEYVAAENEVMRDQNGYALDKMPGQQTMELLAQYQKEQEPSLVVQDIQRAVERTMESITDVEYTDVTVVSAMGSALSARRNDPAHIVVRVSILVPTENRGPMAAVTRDAYVKVRFGDVANPESMAHLPAVEPIASWSQDPSVGGANADAYRAGLEETLPYLVRNAVNHALRDVTPDNYKRV